MICGCMPSTIEEEVKILVAHIYTGRKLRRVHPEGRFDGQRFYPSPREDADGSGTRVRAPSRAWPFSYMHRCRSKQHCQTLLARACVGFDVPADVGVWFEHVSKKDRPTFAAILVSMGAELPPEMLVRVDQQLELGV